MSLEQSTAILSSTSMEAVCSNRDLLKDDPVFYVPEVIADVSTKEVLTTELVSGTSLDKVMDADQDTKNWVSPILLSWG